MAIRGSLREASLPDVLQLLALGKKAGCLSVSHRSNFGSIYFDRGRIVYASIVNRRDRLGDMLLKNGLVTAEQLEGAIEAQQRVRHKRLGELLVERGAISAEDLLQAIRVQIEEAVYFLFTWTQGTFNFEPDVLPESQDVVVSINPETLLLEGARRVDEWELIEKKIPTFDIIFEADRGKLIATDARLTDEQRTILELVDGLRDVQAIIDESGLVEFDAGKALYGLISAGFIQRVGTSAPAAPRSASDDGRVEEHRNLGIAFYKTGMLDEATREFRRVLDLRPEDKGARGFLGLLAARREEWPEAERAFADAAAGPGGKFALLHNHAYILERMGRLDDAEVVIQEAARRGGQGDTRVLISAATLLLKRGRLADADAALVVARERWMGGRTDTVPSPVWYHLAGLVAALRGDLPRAAMVLEEGVTNHPHAASLANNLAVVLERRGMLGGARAAADRGLHENVGLPQLHKNLGDLHYRAGRFDDAETAYLRARAIDPALGGDLYFKLGNIHLRRQETDHAARCWERSLELNPANAIVRTNLASVRDGLR